MNKLLVAEHLTSSNVVLPYGAMFLVMSTRCTKQMSSLEVEDLYRATAIYAEAIYE